MTTRLFVLDFQLERISVPINIIRTMKANGEHNSTQHYTSTQAADHVLSHYS